MSELRSWLNRGGWSLFYQNADATHLIDKLLLIICLPKCQCYAPDWFIIDGHCSTKMPVLRTWFVCVGWMFIYQNISATHLIESCRLDVYLPKCRSYAPDWFVVADRLSTKMPVLRTWLIHYWWSLFYQNVGATHLVCLCRLVVVLPKCRCYAPDWIVSVGCLSTKMPVLRTWLIHYWWSLFYQNAGAMHLIDERMRSVALILW